MPEDVALRHDVATEPFVGERHSWLHAPSPMTSALMSESVQPATLRPYVPVLPVHAGAVAGRCCTGMTGRTERTSRS
jgi:hypothetical protein